MTGIKLVVENVTVKYGDEVVLEDFNLEVNGYGLIQILGPNGAGKSTLLKTITGLIKPVKGRVLINDIDVTGRPDLAGRFIGYVPQMTTLSDHYPITLYDLIYCCYILGRKWPRIRSKRGDREFIEKILTNVGLPRDKWFKKVGELSGGERQKGFIARALVRNPLILLMDEPFSNIDPESRVDLAELINSLKKNRLLIVTSHDPTILLPYTDKILLLNRRIYFYGDPNIVLREEYLSKIYGGALKYFNGHIHIIDSHV